MVCTCNPSVGEAETEESPGFTDSQPRPLNRKDSFEEQCPGLSSGTHTCAHMCRYTHPSPHTNTFYPKCTLWGWGCSSIFSTAKTSQKPSMRCLYCKLAERHLSGCRRQHTGGYSQGWPLSSMLHDYSHLSILPQRFSFHESQKWLPERYIGHYQLGSNFRVTLIPLNLIYLF